MCIYIYVYIYIYIYDRQVVPPNSQPAMFAPCRPAEAVAAGGLEPKRLSYYTIYIL